MSNWDQLQFRSSPNEIGDMLAGFAGALAFIWIVVTVLLQAAELREQRDQFEKMAVAQEEQVSLLVRQGEIFLDEQKDRAEARAKRVLVRSLEVLKKDIYEAAEADFTASAIFGISEFNRDECGVRRGSRGDNVVLYEAFDPGKPVDDAFILLAERARTRYEKMAKFIGPRVISSASPCQSFPVLSKFDEILSMRDALSREDQLYLELLDVEKTLKNWLGLMRFNGIER